MSKYDVALDCQIDWASFWTSEEGCAFFHKLIQAIDRQRAKVGEKESETLARQEAEEMALVTGPLLEAPCYYWSPQMMEVISTTSASLPEHWSLMKHHVPSTSGFFYLAKEADLEPSLGEFAGIAALAWSVLSIPSPGKNEPTAVYMPHPNQPMPEFNALSLVMFLHHHDDRFPFPVPSRDTLLVGESLKDWELAKIRFANEVDAAVKRFEHNRTVIRLFATMLSFLQQRIMVPCPEGASRATRRRAMVQRQAEAEVNVIKLRSLLYREHREGAREVEWQCQWMVRGHWRDQWYSSLSKHQPIFISPHIKGPAGKPLKNAQRMFAVVR